MNILLVTNIRERKGLWRDATILAGLLGEWDHETAIVDFRDRERLSPHDLAIHLEVVEPWFFQGAERHWWIPNPEWAMQKYLSHIERFEFVLCKTRDAKQALREYTDRAILIGFTSEDRRDESIERERVFFHAFRGSLEKGTRAVRGAWEDLEWPIVLADGLDEETFRHEQNRCLFHLCPSEYEGWGHTIHEALSVGAIVVSTDAAPMNETEGVAHLIEPVSSRTLRLATTNQVDGAGVRRAAEWCMDLTDEQVARYSRAARAAFERETRAFRWVFGMLLLTKY